MALRLAAIEKHLELKEKERQQHNLMLQQAFSMVDMHQQILQRIARELAYAVAKRDISHVMLRTDGQLDMHAYYTKYREVCEAAGPEYQSTAVVVWSHGHSVEEAVARAKLEVDKKQEPPVTEEADAESDYEVESFGGDLGKSNNEQEQAAAQEGG